MKLGVSNMNKDDFYIFFDVDGVLNKKSDWQKKYAIDINCIKILKDMVKYYNKKYANVYLVICSTWRFGVSNDGKELDTEQVKALKRMLLTEGLSIYDKTPKSNKSRQEEIEYYIRRNDITDYIIIDDDKSLFPNPEKINLYCPDYTKGLTKEDYKKIVKGKW